MKRREFTRKQRAEIIMRATDATGVVCCEGCGLRLGHKPFEIDHTVAEWLIEDKTRPLTIEDGKLLGMMCCHRNGKTQNDQRVIAKTKRQRDKHTGAFKAASRPIPGSKASGIRKRMDGSVERW